MTKFRILTNGPIGKLKLEKGTIYTPANSAEEKQLRESSSAMVIGKGEEVSPEGTLALAEKPKPKPKRKEGK